MTSQAQIRNSPYVVAFMLAAMMVWSFSAVTRSMDGALQQTHVQLRAPIADLGTGIQDSAIALRHRLRPPPPVEQPSQPEAVKQHRPSTSTLPVIEELAPVTIPAVVALNDLISSSNPGKGKGNGSAGKTKHVRPLHFSAAASDVLGPPSPSADAGPGRGRAPAHAGR